MTPAVILPVYQGERYLAKAIASVLAQTHRAWRLFVVDDGSTDASAAIAYAFAERDKRVTVLRQPHSGVSAARNLALEAAAGHEWIACLDHDDMMLPTRIERQLAFIAERGDDVAAFASRALYIDADGEIIGQVTPVPIHCRADMHRHLSEGRLIALNQPSVMMRRAAVLDVGAYHPDMAAGEDVDLWMRLAQAGYLVVQHDEVLTLYRMHPDSASAQFARDSCMTAQWVTARADARRFGRREPSRAEFEAIWQGKPLIVRLAAQRVFYGWVYFRRAGMYRGSGDWLRGAGWLAAATALRPGYVAARVWRQLADQGAAGFGVPKS